MLIKTAALRQHLQQPLVPVYIVCGTDLFFLQEATRLIERAWKHHALQQVEQDSIDKQSFEIGQNGQSWLDLDNELKSYSLFAEKTLYQLSFNKSSLDKKAQSMISDFANSNSTHATLIITGSQLKQKSLAALQKQQNIVVVPVWSLKPNEFIGWIHQQLQKFFAQTPITGAQMIARFCQNNPFAARQIIAKLKLTQPLSQPLSEAVIAEQLSNQCEFQVFELSDACLQGDAVQVTRIANYLHGNPSEINLMLWVISKEVRLLIRLHELSKQQPFLQACQSMGIWQSKIQQYQAAMQRNSLENLYQYAKLCQQVDQLIKTGKSLRARTAIEQISLSIATGKAGLVHG